MNHNQPLTIPIDPARTPGQQIGAALLALPAVSCLRHPSIQLQLRLKSSVEASLEIPGWESRRRDDPAFEYEFIRFNKRCRHCPYSVGNRPVKPNAALGVEFILRRCTAEVWGDRPNALDASGMAIPSQRHVEKIEADVTSASQLAAWSATLGPAVCSYHDEHGEVLEPAGESVKPRFVHYRIVPRYESCPACSLEKAGVAPNDSLCSFENFELAPPGIAAYVAKCRQYATSPAGVLLMVGSPGNGKTHLAVAILQELSRKSLNLRYIKHSDFLRLHRLTYRPVGNAGEQPQDILAACQEVGLLVFDDLGASVGGPDNEALLLSLFDYRIGNFLPTIVTSNLVPHELEPKLGSRLFDRLKQASFALLKFNFPSRRTDGNAAYLGRCAAGMT